MHVIALQHRSGFLSTLAARARLDSRHTLSWPDDDNRLSLTIKVLWASRHFHPREREKKTFFDRLLPTSFINCLAKHNTAKKKKQKRFDSSEKMRVCLPKNIYKIYEWIFLSTDELWSVEEETDISCEGHTEPLARSSFSEWMEERDCFSASLFFLGWFLLSCEDSSMRRVLCNHEEFSQQRWNFKNFSLLLFCCCLLRDLSTHEKVA